MHTGHKHDGTAANGPVIGLIGDAGLATPLNKINIDTTNKHLEFNINVGGNSVEQFKLQDGGIVPTTTNDIDLGTSSLQFKDAYFDGTCNFRWFSNWKCYSYNRCRYRFKCCFRK